MLPPTPIAGHDSVRERNSSLLCQFPQACRQFFINSSEPTIRKNRHHIAAAHLRGGHLHNFVRVGEKPRPSAIPFNLGGERGTLQALVFPPPLRRETPPPQSLHRPAPGSAPGRSAKFAGARCWSGAPESPTIAPSGSAPAELSASQQSRWDGEQNRQ